MASSKTDRALRILIGILMGAFVYILYASMHERVIGVGDTAPDFTITADNGRPISPTSFGGKLLVLNFWATWCPPCVQETPSLDQFQRSLAGSGVVVLGVSVDKDEKAYRAFLDRNRVSFLTARDPENKINADFGTFKYPETYIINDKGKVVQKIIGPENWTDGRMLDYVKSLL
ncbi:MAG TPA: TlpA disulfide reductase family protein [Bryobacteraceae bacterium]|nr:TlpA disulfide reductase family protein [Bryobacteraceae bacterium]